MRRVSTAALCALLLGAAIFAAGCGPGLVAVSGGGAGAWFGLQGGDDGKKDSAPALVNTNLVPAVIVTSLIREESPARLNYTLIDPNSDTCGVQIEYAVGAGPFLACTKGTGGDDIIGLASTPGGTSHVFHWDFATDLGPQRTQDLGIRMRAQDGVQFGNWFTLSNLGIGNDGPVLSNVNLIGNTGVLLITFDITDQNSDLAAFGIEWSIDQAQSWTPVVNSLEILGNPPANLLSSPSGSPGQIIWNSGVALTNYLGGIFLRFAPSDQPPGYAAPTPSSPVVAGPFPVDNTVNQPPVLQLQSAYSGQTFVSRVPIDFTLADGESDAAAVVVQYTIDGTNFFAATLPGQFASGAAGPFPTSPSPTFYGIRWDALADLAGQPGLNSTGIVVQLLLTPADANAGVAVLTDQFTVVGNAPPAVTAVTVLNSFGNVPIVIRVSDSSADPVSLELEFSTNGVNFTPLGQADLTFGNLASLPTSTAGEDSVLVWDSTRQFNGLNANHPQVFLRVRPTDHPLSATPGADLVGQYFVSGGFPVINDPAGAVPVSIDVFTTNGGGITPSVPQYVTIPLGTDRTLNRTIQPPSAVGFETFWAIVEGPAYGQLVNISGTPLSYATGSITPAAGISDGATFTIDDGFNPAVTFEFDTNSVLPFPSTHQFIAISGMTPAQIVAEVAATISGSGLLVDATAAGSDVTLKHRIACNIGNALSNGGEADDIIQSGACLQAINQLAGGVPVAEVRYVAPASQPVGSSLVTLKCEIDAGAFSNVRDSYVFHWGDAPASVQVTPPSPTVLLNGTVPFAATVQPVTAPQAVQWEVVGGFSNGTIDAGGNYTAPAVMPTSNVVTVRALSAQAGVLGTATVTLLPEPASVSVNTSPTPGVTQIDLSSPTIASTQQFVAAVGPAGAPQAVNWQILWNNNNFGSGSTTGPVGFVSPSGLYTAPQSLPSPNNVQIQALSQAKPGVYGFATLNLQAPPPTSFQLATIPPGPLPVVVFANAQGAQFVPVNFVPANANTSVSWSLFPAASPGSVSSTGYYTPPASVSQQTFVTVRATSALAGSVFADAVVDLRPSVASVPTSVTISPPEGLTHASSAFPIQFSAVVAPPTAQQTVTWSIISVPPRGSIDAAGKYTPLASATDYTETIRATSAVAPNPNQAVIVTVTGFGQLSNAAADIVMGRAQATPVWDTQNNRLWYIGGLSESTDNGNPSPHELSVNWVIPSTTAGAGTFGTGPAINAGFASGPFSVAAAYDSSLSKLWAFCGTGSSTPPRVFSLNLNPIAGAWVEIFPPAGGDVPTLSANVRYPCWFDSVLTSTLVYIMMGNSEVYRFNPVTSSWLSRVSVGTGLAVLGISPAPNDVLEQSFCWVQNTREAYFVGPSGQALDLSQGVRVHAINMAAGSPVWDVRNSSNGPGFRTVYGSLTMSNFNTSSGVATLYLFGGRTKGSSTCHNLMWELTANSPAGASVNFTQHAATGDWPSARAEAALAMTNAANGPVLLGGRNAALDIFGDMWRINTAASPRTILRYSPTGMRPQGRSGAAGAVLGGSVVPLVPGTGYVFGGATDVGVSDELWAFTISGGAPFWSLLNPTGTKPPGLFGAAMAADPQGQRLIMFGGSTSEKSPESVGTNNVYVYTTGVWQLLNPGGTKPPARFGAAICPVFNASNVLIAVYVFGGEGAAGKRNDLWKLDVGGGLPGTWVQVAAVSAPDTREGATMGWDSRRNKLLMLGGNTASFGVSKQYLEFDIATSVWSQGSPVNTGQEEAIYASGAVYDNVCRRFLHAPPTKPKNQALVVTIPSATAVTPAWQYLVAPSGLGVHMTGTTGLFDPATRRYYVVLGRRTVGTRAVGTNGARWMALQ